MATATYCSECGERLKVKRSTLIFPPFCSRCSPRFNRARLGVIVAVTLSTAIGFAAGRLTTAREPFYYIGTPVESGSTSAAPSPDRAASQSARSTDSATKGEQLAPSASVAESICGARTKSGRPCQRKVKSVGHCWQHRDKVGEKASPAK